MTDVLNILWRSVLSFAVLLLMARIMGKKQISQLTFFDYIAGISIGSLAADLSLDIDNIPVINAVVAVGVWGMLTVAMAWIGLKSFRFRQLVDGKPSILIKEGRVQEAALKKERLSIDELNLMLRQMNAFQFADVEFAVMETNGKLSVLKKTDSQPLTPKVQGIPTVNGREPRMVIMDGKVFREALDASGYTEEWLLGEVMKQGADQFSDVFLAQLDAKGAVYVDLYHDEQYLPQVNARSLTAATLKKIKADLEVYALQTRIPDVKDMYENEALEVERILTRMQPYLRG